MVIRQMMNRVFDCVLRIFYRLSTNIESDEDYFNIQFY